MGSGELGSAKGGEGGERKTLPRVRFYGTPRRRFYVTPKVVAIVVLQALLWSCCFASIVVQLLICKCCFESVVLHFVGFATVVLQVLFRMLLLFCVFIALQLN